MPMKVLGSERNDGHEPQEKQNNWLKKNWPLPYLDFSIHICSGT